MAPARDMNLLADFLPSDAESAAERRILFPLFVAGALVVWALARWIRNSPVKPNPWPQEVDAALKEESATPICCRCLEPVGEHHLFCTRCGAATGEYTNWLPFPQLFFIGDW